MSQYIKEIPIVLKIELLPKLLREDMLTPEQLSEYEKYKFRDLGYLILYWQDLARYEIKPNVMNSHGKITPQELKEKLGAKAWQQFKSGKRVFHAVRKEQQFYKRPTIRNGLLSLDNEFINLIYKLRNNSSFKFNKEEEQLFEKLIRKLEQ